MKWLFVAVIYGYWTFGHHATEAECNRAKDEIIRDAGAHATCMYVGDVIR